MLCYIFEIWLQSDRRHAIAVVTFYVIEPGLVASLYNVSTDTKEVLFSTLGPRDASSRITLFQLIVGHTSSEVVSNEAC